jgi:hypothetical protein
MKLTNHEGLRASIWLYLLMIELCLMGMWMGSVVHAQAFNTTTVQGTVYLANGQPGTGTLVVSWPSFTTANGQVVTADNMTLEIAPDGFVSVSLAPNLGATPAGLYYTATFYMSDGSVNTQYWVVPAGTLVTLAQVQAQLMPAAQAVQTVSKTYIDQALESLAGGVLTITGATLTGPLTLCCDPTTPLQAANKHYVDAVSALAVPLTGGTLTGTLTAPQFSGPLSGNVTGNVTGNVSGTAANVTGTVAVGNGGTGATTTTGALSSLGAVPLTGGTLTGTLTAPQFNGPLSGNVTGNVSGTAANVTGTVAVGNGGTGATTTTGALATLGAVALTGGTMTGTLTAPQFNGPLNGDVTGNISGTAANVTGTVAVWNGGTGATSIPGALANLGAVPLTGGTMQGTLTAPQFNGLLSGNVTGNVSGTAANVTGTVAVWNGGTGATTTTGALASLGAVPLTGGTMTGPLTATKLGALYQVDQFAGADFGAKLGACLSGLSTTSGGTCDARNFTGSLSMGSNLTISTANAVVLLPCATISTANQVIVTAGTRNVSLRGCALRGASTASGSQGGTVFYYSGAGAMLQVGDPTYAADTQGFHLDNAVINITAATSASAQGFAAYRTQELDMESLYFLGNSNQTGMTLDGTGNYTGGTFYDNEFTGFQTAVNAIGHQIANPATTDWLNASTFVRLHIDCPMSGGNQISGTYGINLQQGDGNTFTGGDVEGCSTALHLGANAQNNTIVGLRNENSTNQVVADAGSSYNNWITGGTMFTGQLTDNGTRNSFLDTFHRSFNGLNGDWYGSQKDATVTNHWRLGTGTGNERGLVNEIQTDYGYRWLYGFTDATAGEQFYQIQDLLNNVGRLAIGQYNNGQSSTNNQTVINSAGTGAVLLNGSTNSGTGGVVIGSGGPSITTVATVDGSGDAQFNGTLYVGSTSQSTGTMTVRNNADSEVDYYLRPGLTTSQKGSYTYKDWNGNSQWYMVKDQYNNWALNSATGGLDSFKAYQSGNSGDTYIDTSNSTGVVRINYETGSGTQFKVYGGNSGSLYASFTGTTSIQFPGLSAGSGHNCLQIDNSGYITNTGTACGTGNSVGTVNVGVSGQIAYYSGSGTSISGTNTVSVTSGGTGSATASGALTNLGGAALAGASFTGPVSTSGTFSAANNASIGPRYDVTNSAFGAKGDGSTDDTAAIQAAFNACYNGGVVPYGGVVEFPGRHTYNVSSTINAYDSCRIEGVTGSVSTPGAPPRLAWNGPAAGVVSTITAFSISSNVVTFTAANSLTAGQYVDIEGLTAGYYLNRSIIQVSSTGLSGSQFRATLPSGWSNVTTTSDSGTATTVNVLLAFDSNARYQQSISNMELLPASTATPGSLQVDAYYGSRVDTGTQILNTWAEGATMYGYYFANGGINAYFDQGWRCDGVGISCIYWRVSSTDSLGIANGTVDNSSSGSYSGGAVMLDAAACANQTGIHFTSKNMKIEINNSLSPGLGVFTMYDCPSNSNLEAFWLDLENNWVSPGSLSTAGFNFPSFVMSPANDAALSLTIVNGGFPEGVSPNTTTRWVGLPALLRNDMYNISSTIPYLSYAPSINSAGLYRAYNAPISLIGDVNLSQVWHYGIQSSDYLYSDTAFTALPNATTLFAGQIVAPPAYWNGASGKRYAIDVVYQTGTTGTPNSGSTTCTGSSGGNVLTCSSATDLSAGQRITIGTDTNKVINYVDATKPGAVLVNLGSSLGSTYSTATALSFSAPVLGPEIQMPTKSSAAPSTLAWLQGDMLQNSGAAANGVAAWVNVASGTPGTWAGIPLGNSSGLLNVGQVVGAASLSGATFTGAVNGTSANFSGTVTVNNTTTGNGVCYSQGNISIPISCPNNNVTSVPSTTNYLMPNTWSIYNAFNGGRWFQTDLETDQTVFTDKLWNLTKYTPGGSWRDWSTVQNWSIGDTMIDYGIVIGSGGVTGSGDEGMEVRDWGVFQGGRNIVAEWGGAVTAGAGTGSTSITVGSPQGAGTQGASRWLIDYSKAYTTGTITAISGSGSGPTTYTGTGTSWPVSTVNTTLGTAVSAPGVVTASPASMTNITTSTLLVVADPSNIEWLYPSSTTGSTFTATFAKPHPSTAIVMAGGMTGYFVELTADEVSGSFTGFTVTGTVRQAWPILGTTNSTTMQVWIAGHGIWLQSDWFTRWNASTANGYAAYPGAEVVGVTPILTGASEPLQAVTNTLTLGPNAAAWANGDTVYLPMYPAIAYSIGNETLQKFFSCEGNALSCRGGNTQFNGIWAAEGSNQNDDVYEYYNNTPLSYYSGNGGQLTPMRGLYFDGAFSDIIHSQYGPSWNQNQYMLDVGCASTTNGCSDYVGIVRVTGGNSPSMFVDPVSKTWYYGGNLFSNYVQSNSYPTYSTANTGLMGANALGVYDMDYFQNEWGGGYTHAYFRSNSANSAYVQQGGFNSSDVFVANGGFSTSGTFTLGSGGTLNAAAGQIVAANISNNLIYNGGWQYIANGAGSLLNLQGGAATISTAPSGTSGSGANLAQNAIITATGTTFAYPNYAPSLTYGASANFTWQTGSTDQLTIGQEAGSAYEWWMQGRNSSNVADNISLQPLGGNVGIGIKNPGSLLTVAGNIANANGVLLPSTLTGYYGSGAGDVMVQLSDGTGTSGYIAVYDANGGLTNGSSIPASANTLSSNSSRQFVASTSHNLSVPANCAAAGGSGTAYTCTTSPTFTPATGDHIQFKADVANTGSATLNVNGAGAATIYKWGNTTTLTGGDLQAGHWISATYDGSHWQLEGQLGNANATQLNSASIPASTNALSSNTSSQLVASTSHNLSMPANCVAASGSGTAYTCTTSPTFTPAIGDHIQFMADVANTGSATLAVNGATAATFKKWGGSGNLIANDLLSGNWISATYDGTYWQLEGQLGNANATQLNGASIPASANVTSTNSNSQIVASTSHNLSVPANCAAASGSGTAYICTTSPTFTPAAGDHIQFKADVANTGSATLNVNGAGAATIYKWGNTTTLTGGDLQAGHWISATYDGSHWQLEGQLGNANATQLNSASIPASTNALSSNSSSQLVASTSHNLSMPANCIAASGSGTAYTCTTSPTFTPATGDHIQFKADVANTGSATLAVNGATAATFKKWGGSGNLIANDLLSGNWISATFDGTYWQLEGQLGNANATQINGTSLPASVNVTSTNSSSQIVASTTHNLSMPANCIAASGSGTTYTCSTSPTFTPATGDHIQFKADVANTGSATLAVNGATAATFKKWGGSGNLIANDLLSGNWISATFDGTYWQLEGQLGNANATQINGTSISGLSGSGSLLALTTSPTIASPTFTGTVTTPLTTAGVVTTTSGGVLGSVATTGSGSAVLATSPTLVTPTLGAASATSLSLTNPLTVSNGGTGAATASANTAFGNFTTSSAAPSFTATTGTGSPVAAISPTFTGNTTTFANNSASTDYIVIQPGTSSTAYLGGIQLNSAAATPVTEWYIEEDTNYDLKIHDQGATTPVDILTGYINAGTNINSQGTSAVTINNSSTGSGTGGFIVYEGGANYNIAAFTANSSGNASAAGIFTAGGIISGGMGVSLSSATSIAATGFTSTGLALPTIPVSTTKRGMCVLIWEQNTAVGTVQFGMGMNNAPTNLWVINQDSPGTYKAPTYTTINSTTTTAVSATDAPSATATGYRDEIEFTLTTGSSSAVTVTVYGLSSSTSDALVIEPGSYCTWLP